MLHQDAQRRRINHWSNIKKNHYSTLNCWPHYKKDKKRPLFCAAVYKHKHDLHLKSSRFITVFFYFFIYCILCLSKSSKSHSLLFALFTDAGNSKGRPLVPYVGEWWEVKPGLWSQSRGVTPRPTTEQSKRTKWWRCRLYVLLSPLLGWWIPSATSG